MHVSELLATIESEHRDVEILLSVISVTELEHGIYRAASPLRSLQRREYLAEVFATIPVEPLTKPMAQIAAKIDAGAKRAGRVIPFSDLLIGSTAIHFGFAIATRNVRHFRMIDGLDVIRV